MSTKSMKAVEIIERKCIKGELGGAEFTRECFLGTRLGSLVGMGKGWGIGRHDGGSKTECRE